MNRNKKLAALHDGPGQPVRFNITRRCPHRWGLYGLAFLAGQVVAWGVWRLAWMCP